MISTPRIPLRKVHRAALRSLFITAFIALLAVSCSSWLTPAFPGNQSSDSFVELLDRKMPRLMKRYQVPGAAVALIEDGRTVWTGAYGYADQERGIKMSTDTFCRAQSIAKSVTAWGVMKLVEQGKIDLDQPAAAYLRSWNFPGSPDTAGEVTVRQLLTHTSGLQRGTVGVHYDPQSEHPSLRNNLTLEAQFLDEPGEHFTYSNPGYNVLEVLVEDVTGQDFAGYMKREILQPLGMNQADYEWQPGWKPGPAVGYDIQGDPVPAYVYPEKASGGLFATVEDIAAFTAAAVRSPQDANPAVLDPTTQQLLYTPQTTLTGQYRLISDSYGLGHFIEYLPEDRTAVWHGGQGHGWMTHFHAVPEAGRGIVILTNSQRSWPLFARVLRDWSDFNKLGPAGMEIILTGSRVMMGLTALILVLVLRSAVDLLLDLHRGARRWGSWRTAARLQSVLQIGISLALACGLAWFFTREYTFFAVVFPLTSQWLGWSLGAAALVLCTRGFFPIRTHSEQQIPGWHRPVSTGDPQEYN